MHRQMQNAKLVERLPLECSFRGVFAKQHYRIPSDNFTDSLDLFPRFRKILKPHPGKVRHAPHQPCADRVWSRYPTPSPALILVGNITYTEKRTRRPFALARSPQYIKNGSGRHVAYDARPQQILA